MQHESLSPEALSNWVCPMCMSKQPKGDRSKCLARPSTPTSQAEISFNETRRKVHNTAPLLTDTDEYIRRSELRDILREEMSLIIKTHNAQLKSTFDSFAEKITNLHTSVEFMSDKFDRLSECFQYQQHEIEALKKENTALRTEVNSLSNKMHQLDQMSRAATLEIQCLPELKSENVVQIVKQLGRVVKCVINDQDIHYCSRVAKLNPNSSRPRTIIAKFSSPRIRDSVLSAVHQYNKDNSQDKLNTTDFGFDHAKKSPVFVVENLSHENKQLHAAARQRGRDLKYKFVWVRAGRVYMRKSETSNAIFIRDSSMLDKL